MARRFRHHEVSEEEEGELNLTPYLDIITTLVIFMIFTFQVVIEFRMIDVFSPAYQAKSSEPTPSPEDEQVQLSVLVASDSYHLIASKGMGYLQVPKKGASYDTSELRRAAKEWKTQLKLGESIVIMAEGDIEYSVIVETMDALRRDGPNWLFPDVVLGKPPEPGQPVGGTP